MAFAARYWISRVVNLPSSSQRCLSVLCVSAVSLLCSVLVSSFDLIYKDRMADYCIRLLVLEPLKEVVIGEHYALQVSSADCVYAGRGMQQYPQILRGREHVPGIRY